MRTITKTYKVYQFEELSEEAKPVAIDWWRESSCSDEWWEYVYEDAENVGIKITGFDCDRGNFCTFDKNNFDADEVSQKILKDHGETCETYDDAETYQSDKAELIEQAEKDEDGDFVDEYELDEKLAELAEELKTNLQNDYLKMLRNEHEDYFSDKRITENIEANEYEFLEDGSRAA